MLNSVIQSEFPLDSQLIYLNHAAVSPWPRRTAEAVKRFADENMIYGSLHYLQWQQTELELKKRLGKLINAPSYNDIALLKNTSEGLSMVAYGLDWQAGDEIVICRQEFPSNRVVWESLTDRGVRVRYVDLATVDDPEQAIMDTATDRTRLISVSSVQYGNGLRMDLARLGGFCEQNSILFCIDGIQSIGCLSFDVQAFKADFVAADGHKWMIAPEGLALFYCRRETREKLKPSQYGWHMVEHSDDFSAPDWEVAHSSRRFECGSPNTLGVMAMNASISLIQEIGMDEIQWRVLDRTRLLQEKLATLPEWEILSSTEDHRRSGIFTFRHRRIQSDEIYKYLKKHNVMCAMRGGGIRLSPHFYTPMDRLERVITILLEM